MAEAVSSPIASREAANLEVLKDSLYDACQGHGDDTRPFTQRDLLALDILPDRNDVGLLMRVVQGLCDERLFVAVTDARLGLAWRWRRKQDADKYHSLASEEQRMLYAMIDDAGSDGIWTRTLKARLGMHDSVFKTAVKALESRGYVTQLKSVENVNKKMLIKADLRPSDRATGGPWYTDSDLDEAFIAELQMIIFDYITRRSAYRGREEHIRQPKKGVVKGSALRAISGEADAQVTEEGSAQAGSKGLKRTSDAISDDTAQNDTATAAAHVHTHTRHHHLRKDVLQPHPSGYTLYPTVRDIAELIDHSGITNNTTLSEADVQQLVDVLVYDGLIEPVTVGRSRTQATSNGKGKRKIGYRTTRVAKQDPVPSTKRLQDWRESGLDEIGFVWPGAERPTNGYVEVPCGKCPVFELCEEGGPVNPSNCAYFQHWLGKE